MDRLLSLLIPLGKLKQMQEQFSEETEGTVFLSLVSSGKVLVWNPYVTVKMFPFSFSGFLLQAHATHT